jgi:hypothetical protein
LFRARFDQNHCIFCFVALASEDFMMGFMRTFRKNPGRVLKRMEKILSAWQLEGAEDSFYGMTLKEFQETVQPALEVRERLQALETEALALIQRRALLDEKCNEIASGVVFAVRSHSNHGPNSPLYRMMGYVLDSDKRPGRPRKARKDS